MTGVGDGQISIDRTSLSLSPLIIASDGSTALHLIGYREPAMDPNIVYAPGSAYVHGEQALAWSYQQAILNFTVAPLGAPNEAAARSAITDLATALGRLTYTMTITLSGASGETWTCDPGTLTPVDDRRNDDLFRHDPAWSISVPAYPIRS